MGVISAMNVVTAVFFLSLAYTKGMKFDEREYERIKSIAMTDPSLRDANNNRTIKEATVEFVRFHFNGVLGSTEVYTFNPVPSDAGGFLGKRKKRFASFGGPSFGNSGWGNAWEQDPWKSGFGGNSYGSHDSHGFEKGPSFGGHGPIGGPHGGPHVGSKGGQKNPFAVATNTVILNCPSKINQSRDFQISPDPSNYPGLAIGAELFLRPDLFFCLARRAIVPGSGPTIRADENYVTANNTCPSEEMTLYKYVSQKYGRCWVLQGFQEKPTFRSCMTKQCVNCKLEGHERQQNFPRWNSNQYHGNGAASNDRNVTVNQCVETYQTIQILSYCEGKKLNKRIDYDRLIVPAFCACQSVDCPRVHLNDHPTFHPQPPHPHPHRHH